MDQIPGGFHISHSSIGHLSPRNEAVLIPNRDLAALPGGNTVLLPGDRFQSLQSLVGRERAAGLPVQAYLSCVLGCPYEGPVSPERVASLAGRLHELGCE